MNRNKLSKLLAILLAVSFLFILSACDDAGGRSGLYNFGGSYQKATIADIPIVGSWQVDLDHSNIYLDEWFSQISNGMSGSNAKQVFEFMSNKFGSSFFVDLAKPIMPVFTTQFTNEGEIIVSINAPLFREGIADLYQKIFSKMSTLSMSEAASLLGISVSDLQLTIGGSSWSSYCAQLGSTMASQLRSSLTNEAMASALNGTLQSGNTLILNDTATYTLSGNRLDIVYSNGKSATFTLSYNGYYLTIEDVVSSTASRDDNTLTALLCKGISYRKTY